MEIVGNNMFCPTQPKAAGVAPPRFPLSSPKSQKRCVLLRGPIYNQAKGAREEGAEHFIIKRRAASTTATAVALQAASWE